MDTTRIKLLLIEDDEEDYILTRAFLDESPREHFDIQWARTMAEGVEFLSGNVDAVLLDLHLPDSFGWETFATVHNAAPHVPVVLLTGSSDEDLGAHAVQEGAQDFMVKGSMNAQMLCRSIRYAIERKQIEERLSEVVDELRARNEQMDAELALAHDMQFALLPRRYPRFPASAPESESALRFYHHYRPCLELGGDFFYVHGVSDSVAVVLVCDVMGHGVRSALVTAVVRGLVEELSETGLDDPGILMSELNRDLTRLLRQPDQLTFVSAACVLIDTDNGRLSWANAGHPPPLWVHSDTGNVERLSGGEKLEPAMGIDGGVAYCAHIETLSAGDRVVLYTDGLYEVLNAEGQELGEDAFVELVRDHAGCTLRTMLDRIVVGVETHAGTPQLDDDVCLVGMEYVCG